MPKKIEEKDTPKLSDADVATVLERLRIAVPRITKLEVKEGVAHIDVPPFQLQTNDSLRQRSIVAETGLSGAELATLEYIITTDKKILEVTGGVELTLKTIRV